jgi:hypothetical protein
LLSELAAIEGEDDFSPLGQVPPEWLDQRTMGTATTEGEFADICGSEWISKLRKLLPAQLEKFGVDDLDASVLQQTAPRILTQFVSRIVFYEDFAGIYYRSKYGHDIENWALFEPFRIGKHSVESIVQNDPDLQRALELHGLRFGPR